MRKNNTNSDQSKMVTGISPVRTVAVEKLALAGTVFGTLPRATH